LQVTPGAGKQDPVAEHPADSAKPQRSSVAQSASVVHGPEPLPVSLAPELLVDPELLLDDPPLDPELALDPEPPLDPELPPELELLPELLSAPASPMLNAAPEQPLPQNAAPTATAMIPSVWRMSSLQMLDEQVACQREPRRFPRIHAPRCAAHALPVML
jgi:hypothetical protein